jgi:hypothetical protein
MEAKTDSPVKNTAFIRLWHGTRSDIRTDKKERELSHEFVGNTMIQFHE